MRSWEILFITTVLPILAVIAGVLIAIRVGHPIAPGG
jgi:hypothetical protein